MNRKLSYSVEEDFLGEFRKDTAANPKGWGITANYFELGLYANQLQRFLNFFPEKQIKVILYDDFRLAPQETLAATFEFLEVDTNHVPNTETQKNKAALPVWPKFYQFLFQTGLAHMIKHRIPASLREVIEKVIFSQSILPKLSASDRQYLIELYQSDISLLATILNRNLDHWLI
jgi:hypothetical protein